MHGSVEAIIGTLQKLSTDEVKVNVLRQGVGGITESDITLARASQAMVVGFNVRANAQARDSAKRDGIDIRYYSIIYELVDDVKARWWSAKPEERELPQLREHSGDLQRHQGRPGCRLPDYRWRGQRGAGACSATTRSSTKARSRPCAGSRMKCRRSPTNRMRYGVRELSDTGRRPDRVL